MSVPTSVTATNGDYINKVGINWDTIRGATQYRVYRNLINDPLTATELGTTEASFFFDTSAPINQTLFYWVRAENISAASELSESAQGLRRLGTANGPRLPLEPPPTPTGNPITATKISLGKALFWEEQLSSTKTVSCGTCHINRVGGSDPNSVISNLESTNPGPDATFGTGDDITGSPGVPASLSGGDYQWNPNFGLNKQVTTRKANATVNAAYAPLLFWDGRASNVFRDPVTDSVLLAAGAALESQAAGPPLSDVEMAHSGRDWNQAAAQIANAKPLALVPSMPAALATWINGRSYPELFEEAFGTPEVTPARIAMALATYQRVLYSDRAPVDRLFSGQNTLTVQEQRGLNVFNGANCNACHGGGRFTNDAFIYIGVRPVLDDLGRFAQTSQNVDRGAFRVPSLRNVELRAPYMHNGRFGTLEEVVAFYNRGGDFNAPNKAPAMVPQGLTAQQQADLVAFLKRPLTDERVANETGVFDRPVLYSESNRVPVVAGTGRAGAGGTVPKVIAIEPPLVGNPSFTVAVANTVPGAQAVLVIGEDDPGVGTSIPAIGSFARETTTTNSSGTGIGYGSVSIAIPDNANLIGRVFFGRWYIADPLAVNGFSVSQVFQFKIFGESANTSSSEAIFDFDGDGKTDISVFRPVGGSGSEWWYLRSSDGGNRAFAFGKATDTIVPADFTGDGKTDLAFWRPASGEWFVLRSEDSTFFAFPFGAAGDVPSPADFDGDGRSDATVYRPSTNTWFTLRSSDGQVAATPFGTADDKPVPADYDGDGKADVAIFRPTGGSGGGEWWYLRSSDGANRAFAFGSATDLTLPGDYTGDGKADLAYFRPSTGEWYVLRSEDSSFYAFPWGTSGDLPAPGDYDGDGKIDAAVFRPSNSNWFALRSTAGPLILQFGTTGDRPLPNAFVR
ncbi:MAG: VCBS repeat-containing protein [Acidobacteria bacterium]|nr:VCBS repeat-containing protein [Acidobacteriota bacterium]